MTTTHTHTIFVEIQVPFIPGKPIVETTAQGVTRCILQKGLASVGSEKVRTRSGGAFDAALQASG
jgi:hypothetical protein